MENKVIKAKREIVDKNIYLKQSIEKKPTQRFIQTLNLIQKNLKNKVKFCDVGCANGGFINFVKKNFPQNEYYGIEKNIDLAKECKKNIPDVNLIKVDIEKKINIKYKFDCMTMIGILMNFDQPKKSIQNCLKLLKKNGKLVIYSPFNEFPIDTITRSRRSKNSYWELGWNIHSKYTVEKILKSLKVKSYKWKNFVINFQVKKKKDPLRAWTVNINGKKTLINGASQYIDGKFLIIKK
jgi:2-polyprenyl-3-methyl-5-hydroxy-6-metoxy-1,4-benzoquinol methylase